MLIFSWDSSAKYCVTTFYAVALSPWRSRQVATLLVMQGGKWNEAGRMARLVFGGHDGSRPYFYLAGIAILADLAYCAFGVSQPGFCLIAGLRVISFVPMGKKYSRSVNTRVDSL